MNPLFIKISCVCSRSEDKWEKVFKPINFLIVSPYGLHTHPSLTSPKRGMLMEYAKRSLISFLEHRDAFPEKEVMLLVSSSVFLEHFASSKVSLRLCFATFSRCNFTAHKCWGFILIVLSPSSFLSILVHFLLKERR